MPVETPTIPAPTITTGLSLIPLLMTFALIQANTSCEITRLIVTLRSTATVPRDAALTSQGMNCAAAWFKAKIRVAERFENGHEQTDATAQEF